MQTIDERNAQKLKELQEAVEATTALVEKRKYRWIDFVFPDTGKYPRQEYKKAMEFFKAGADHRLRMLGGANGSGKSFNTSLEMVYHCTGLYPKWWVGKRQKNPKLWWIISESGGTFKSSMQRLLIGSSLNEEDVGTGFIPKELIVSYGAMQGVSGALSYIQVRHINGHIVTIEVKQSEQKRENLQAATLDGVLFDEEPPEDIYTECVIRLRGSPTKEPGISMLGFTPLKGVTPVVLKYLPNGMYPEFGEHPDDPSKYIVRIEMDEVPHMSEEDKRMYLNESEPHQLEARTKGFPALGSGRIYPIPEDDILVDSFSIPKNWPRAFAWDFGWHLSAGLWGAKDPNTGIIYLYAEYYKGQLPLDMHVAAIKEMGFWIPGIADPSGGGRNENGQAQADLYMEKGIDFRSVENSKLLNDSASGITRVFNKLQTGQVKVMKHLRNWRNEFRLFRYDEKDPNKPARNQKDHLMDSTKYLTFAFDDICISYDEISDEWEKELDKKEEYQYKTGQSNITGY